MTKVNLTNGIYISTSQKIIAVDYQKNLYYLLDNTTIQIPAGANPNNKVVNSNYQRLFKAIINQME